eukprot:1806296-Rhodomonas_salina.4
MTVSATAYNATQCQYGRKVYAYKCTGIAPAGIGLRVRDAMSSSYAFAPEAMVPPCEPRVFLSVAACAVIPHTPCQYRTARSLAVGCLTRRQ